MWFKHWHQTVTTEVNCDIQVFFPTRNILSHSDTITHWQPWNACFRSSSSYWISTLSLQKWIYLLVTGIDGNLGHFSSCPVWVSNGRNSKSCKNLQVLNNFPSVLPQYLWSSLQTVPWLLGGRRRKGPSIFPSRFLLLALLVSLTGEWPCQFVDSLICMPRHFHLRYR